jgi:hypothetical protein
MRIMAAALYLIKNVVIGYYLCGIKAFSRGVKLDHDRARKQNRRGFILLFFEGMPMFYYQETGNVRLGSGEVFRMLTGAEWTEEMRGEANEDEAVRFVPGRADSEWMRFLIPLYKAYKKNPPKLCIHQGPCKGRHSVHALEPIGKGTVVVEYLGEWAAGSLEHSGYRFGPIEAKRFRNGGGMVEDGFPNLGAFHLYGIGNFPLRVIFVALEDIPAGEIVTIHYGMNHSVKTQYHTEYRIEQLERFFSRNPLEKIVKRIKELRMRTPAELGWGRSLELENLTAKLRYLYQTPSALMHLLLKQILTEDQVFSIFGQAEFRYFMVGYPYQPNPREREVIDYLDLIKTFFSPGRLVDDSASALMGQIRQRIFFSYFLKEVIKGANQDEAREQALLWNEVFDAIQMEDRAMLEFKLEQVRERDLVIQASLAYAKELRSSLTGFLTSLAKPPQPLRTAG